MYSNIYSTRVYIVYIVLEYYIPIYSIYIYVCIYSNTRIRLLILYPILFKKNTHNSSLACAQVRPTDLPIAWRLQWLACGHPAFLVPPHLVLSALLSLFTQGPGLVTSRCPWLWRWIDTCCLSCPARLLKVGASRNLSLSLWDSDHRATFSSHARFTKETAREREERWRTVQRATAVSSRLSSCL